MKRLLMFAGAIGALTLASRSPAVPPPAFGDPWVDGISFGRVVYGMTGGAVTLPADAWEGYYPDGSGSPNNAVPADLAFSGGAFSLYGHVVYGGDTSLVTPRDYAYVLAHPGSVTPDIAIGTPSGGGVISVGTAKTAMVISSKIGMVSKDGWNSSVSLFAAPSLSPLTTLFGTHTTVGSVSSVTVGNPFGLAYSDTTQGTTYYSDLPANNTGDSSYDKSYNHSKIYEVTSGKYAGTYFVGFEDVNFNPYNKGPNYHRMDWNDTVIALTATPVPEPAFYQMAGLLSLGAFGMLKMRRRSVS